MNRIKKAVKATLFCLAWLWAANVSATTYYVATTGSNISGSGSSGTPWATVAYALTKVASGDVVSINDGIYSEGQLVVPVGVSLTSTSQDNTKVKVHPNINLGTSEPFILLSSAAGTNGNQTISYLEIAGRNSSFTTRIGIGVKSRDNVRIHHCNIHDFYGVINAAGVEVQSVQLPPTNQWWNLWPADPQALGTDENIEALWPARPVENFELDNNSITDCGWFDTNRTGAVTLWHLKNSTLHHNHFSMPVSRGQAITGRGLKTAMLWNVDVYNNTFAMGAKYNENKQDTWAIELWVMRGGCQFYNNIGTGWYSITVGKETTVYNNSLTIYPEETDKGIGIEFNMQSHGSVYGNYIENTKWGITVGLGLSVNPKDFISEHVTVRNNVIYNANNSGIFLYSFGGDLSPSKVTARYFDIYNNVIDGQIGSAGNYRGLYGITVKQQNYVGTSTLSNVNIKNNVVTNQYSYAGQTSGATSNVFVDHNLFYGCINNDWNGSIDMNTIIADPGFIVEGVNFKGYTPTNSPPIDSGVNDSTYSSFGIGFEGTAPDIGAIEGVLLPATAPANLVAIAIDYATVNLVWNDNSVNEDGFSIWRSTDGVNFDSIKTVAANGSDYEDNGLTASTKYYYRVFAFNSNEGSLGSTLIAYAITKNASAIGAIIDNTDPGFSIVGTWGTSTFSPGFYGSNYQFSNAAAVGTNTAKWTFDITKSGLYEVSVQWPPQSGGFRAKQVQYKIRSGASEWIIPDFNQDTILGNGKFCPLDTVQAEAGQLILEVTSSPTGPVIADAAQIRMVNVTSVKGISEIQGIRIYPNPVKDALIITGELGKYSLEVFNVHGRKVHRQENLSGTTVRMDMSGYIPGIYIMKLTDGSGRQVVRKIMKE